MFTVDIINSKVVDEGREYVKKIPVINGIPDPDAFYDDRDYVTIHVYNTDIIGILVGHSFVEVGAKFAKLVIEFHSDKYDEVITATIHCNHIRNEVFPKIYFKLDLGDLEQWEKPWSISKFAAEFEASLKLLGDIKYSFSREDEETNLNGFGLMYYPDSVNLNIESEFDIGLEKLENIIGETTRNLLLSIDKDILVTHFNFPNETKAVCKQYLIYFSQFMADIGIHIDTEIRDEVGQTLFKVIPKDGEEGLQRIKEALDIYLKSPFQESFDSESAHHRDISVMQWQANVQHLKSQLLLAKSIIQLKDATIESLSLSNFQYKQIIGSKIQDDPIDKKEDVIKGVVSVKTFEWQGVSVNLAEIFRILKRKFS